MLHFEPALTSYLYEPETSLLNISELYFAPRHGVSLFSKTTLLKTHSKFKADEAHRAYLIVRSTRRKEPIAPSIDSAVCRA